MTRTKVCHVPRAAENKKTVSRWTSLFKYFPSVLIFWVLVSNKIFISSMHILILSIISFAWFITELWVSLPSDHLWLPTWVEGSPDENLDGKLGSFWKLWKLYLKYGEPVKFCKAFESSMLGCSWTFDFSIKVLTFVNFVDNRFVVGCLPEFHFNWPLKCFPRNDVVKQPFQQQFSLQREIRGDCNFIMTEFICFQHLLNNSFSL